MASAAIIYVNKVNLVMDISPEITFQTARSGGKGGQNVNKVETMVAGYWHIQSSTMLNPEQKLLLAAKLANKITSEGYLLVKSQSERTQLANKEQVILKMNLLVTTALIIQKKRRPTKPGRAAREKRINTKKKAGEIKQTRMKIKF